MLQGDGKDRFRGTHIKTKANEGEYDLSRYKTVIQHMIEEHQNGRLSTTQFPYLRDVPQELMPSMRGHTASPVAAAAGTSLRSARPTWQKPSSARNLGEGRQRYIIFIAGGVTYSEIRQVYELSKAFNKDIYIGSTHIVTPEQFLKDLRSLGRGGIGGNPPHAPRQDPRNPGRPGGRPPGGPMPYQR